MQGLQIKKGQAMLRSYLIENRICYDGDGGSNGGGNGGNNDQEPERAFGEQRLAGGTTNVVDTSRRANPAVELSDEDFDQDLQQDIAASAALRRGRAAGQPLGTTESGLRLGTDLNPFTVGDQASDLFRSDRNAFNQVVNATSDIIGSTNPMATQQQLAQDPALQQTLVSLSGGVAPQAAPSRQEQSAFRRELANNLIQDAAQQSLANPDRPTPINQVAAAPGRNDPMSGFFADAYDELYGGTPPGTGMATIFGSGPLSFLLNSPDPADAQAFNVGTLQRMARETGTGTVDPNTGAVTGVQAGPGTLSMNALGGVVYSGRNDPNYEGPFANLVRGTAGMNMAGDDNGGSQPATTIQPADPIDPGTTTPEQIDDLAINYLRNPFFLYSGQGNLFQPYGYAGGTLVDLLQTRGMTPPQQAAANLNLFGNPRDFV